MCRASHPICGFTLPPVGSRSRGFDALARHDLLNRRDSLSLSYVTFYLSWAVYFLSSCVDRARTAGVEAPMYILLMRTSLVDCLPRSVPRSDDGRPLLFVFFWTLHCRTAILRLCLGCVLVAAVVVVVRQFFVTPGLLFEYSRTMRASCLLVARPIVAVVVVCVAARGPS
ncbi:hypothetical protein FKP32DRAFT_1090312 [Trametes sanguinea]|nr:hypothetical protein FKP32DRAFT_1090312 [Trametes sanguinea]